MSRKFLLVSLLLLATPAFAQQQTSTAEQQAVQQQAQHLAQAAGQVAQLIDNDQAGQVWDGAAASTKQTVKRDAFVQGLYKQRHPLGALKDRQVKNYNYSQANGTNELPAGLYFTVTFESRFAKQKKPVQELISFHLDNDKVWRVSGYTVR